jgi:ATP-binding cassette subfamily B protein
MKKRQTELRKLGRAMTWLWQLDGLVFGMALALGVINAGLAFELILGNSQVINQLAVNVRGAAITTILWTYGAAFCLALLSITTQRAITVRATRDNEQLKMTLFASWQSVAYEQLASAEYFGGMMKADASFRYSGGVPVLCTQLVTLCQRVLTATAGISLVGFVLIKGSLSHPFIAWWTLGVVIVVIGFVALTVRGYQQLTRANVAHYKVLMGLERQMNYFLLGIVTKYESLKSIKLWGLAPVIQHHYR